MRARGKFRGSLRGKSCGQRQRRRRVTHGGVCQSKWYEKTPFLLRATSIQKDESGREDKDKERAGQAFVAFLCWIRSRNEGESLDVIVAPITTLITSLLSSSAPSPGFFSGYFCR